MTPHYADALVTLYLGDCVAVMRELPADSVDAIVTDPPYGLEFMGKEWDRLGAAPIDKRMVVDPAAVMGNQDSPNGGNAFSRSRIRNGQGAGTSVAMGRWHEAWAREAFRVAKPGAHLLAFGGTRTYHRLASAIEDAGWEIRDCLVWAYASGFPKSLNIGNGMGTALKPAWEPIVMARKPLRGTVSQTVLEYGTGALNIDATRIPGAEDGSRNRPPSRLGSEQTYAQDEWTRTAIVERQDTTGKGRWPANLLLSDDLDAVLGDGFSRFFAVPKSSRSDREPLVRGDVDEYEHSGPRGHTLNGDGTERLPTRPRANSHPTVKPLDLMRHLVRLVTPPGGTVLDCFLGSGTTAIAANSEGFRCIGIEREREYLDIALARMAHQPLGMAL